MITSDAKLRDATSVDILQSLAPPLLVETHRTVTLPDVASVIIDASMLS